MQNNIQKVDRGLTNIIKFAYITVLSVMAIIMVWAIGKSLWSNRGQWGEFTLALLGAVGAIVLLLVWWALCDRFPLMRIATKAIIASLGLVMVGYLSYCLIPVILS